MQFEQISSRIDSLSLFAPNDWVGDMRRNDDKTRIQQHHAGPKCS